MESQLYRARRDPNSYSNPGSALFGSRSALCSCHNILPNSEPSGKRKKNTAARTPNPPATSPPPRPHPAAALESRRRTCPPRNPPPRAPSPKPAAARALVGTPAATSPLAPCALPARPAAARPPRTLAPPCHRLDPIANESLSATPCPIVVVAKCLAAAERRLPSGSHAPSERRRAFSHQCVAPVSSRWGSTAAAPRAFIAATSGRSSTQPLEQDGCWMLDLLCYYNREAKFELHQNLEKTG